MKTPVVMVCAGTGLAPFRGFLQDRALQAAQQGVRPAPALLFFGCDAPDVDYLYDDELAAWAEQGIVDVRPAFSAPEGDRPQFVQDRLWADRADVANLVERGAGRARRGRLNRARRPYRPARTGAARNAHRRRRR